MNLQTEFNTTQSNADFLSDHWRPEHCDPANWNQPNTHGVEGVFFEGDMEMKRWDELKSWKNPGRKYGTVEADAQELAKRIIKEAKTNPKIYSTADVMYAKLIKRRLKNEQRFSKDQTEQ